MGEGYFLSTDTFRGVESVIEGCGRRWKELFGGSGGWGWKLNPPIHVFGSSLLLQGSRGLWTPRTSQH